MDTERVARAAVHLGRGRGWRPRCLDGNIGARAGAPRGAPRGRSVT